MRGGLAETWTMVKLGTRRTTERVRDGNLHLRIARAVYLLDALDIDVLRLVKVKG